MALKTPPIKTLGVAGLVRMAIDIDKDGLTHDMDEELYPAEEREARARERAMQKSLTEIFLLKTAAFLMRIAGGLLQYAEELAELREEAYKRNVPDEDASEE